MLLESLKLKNFRNYKELEIQFDNQFCIFIGRNGQGKTNLLEAALFSVGGSPFRVTKAESLIKKGQLNGLIEAQIKSQSIKNTVGLTLEEKTKKFFLNEKKTTRSQIWKKFGAVTFSPESLKIVKSGPSERRYFVDEMIVSIKPEKWNDYTDYQKSLKQRNALLKQIKEDGSIKKNKEVLTHLTEIWLEKALRITELRLQFLKKLNEKINSNFKEHFFEQNVDIAVDYLISERSAIAWNRNQVYDALRSKQMELEQAEISYGQTLSGPQKHDLLFLYNKEDARFFCSQGQQRSIILAAKVAHIELFKEKRGFSPILLLDDVLSELDETRRSKLIEVLFRIETSIFLTSTEVDDFVSSFEIKPSLFEVQDGTVKKQGWI